TNGTLLISNIANAQSNITGIHFINNVAGTNMMIQIMNLGTGNITFTNGGATRVAQQFNITNSTLLITNATTAGLGGIMIGAGINITNTEDALTTTKELRLVNIGNSNIAIAAAIGGGTPMSNNLILGNTPLHVTNAPPALNPFGGPSTNINIFIAA